MRSKRGQFVGSALKYRAGSGTTIQIRRSLAGQMSITYLQGWPAKVWPTKARRHSFFDVALTVVHYLLQASKTDTNSIGMNVSDMTVNKPLIAIEKGPQLFRASTSADRKAQRILINFYSVRDDGRSHLIMQIASSNWTILGNGQKTGDVLPT